jgi:hypothetical protein
LNSPGFDLRLGRATVSDHHRRKRGLPGTASGSGRQTTLETVYVALAELIPPGEQLLRPQTMTPDHIGDHHPVAAALRDNRQLLLVAPIPQPPTNVAGQNQASFSTERFEKGLATKVVGDSRADSPVD